LWLFESLVLDMFLKYILNNVIMPITTKVNIAIANRVSFPESYICVIISYFSVNNFFDTMMRFGSGFGVKSLKEMT